MLKDDSSSSIFKLGRMDSDIMQHSWAMPDQSVTSGYRSDPARCRNVDAGLLQLTYCTVHCRARLAQRRSRVAKNLFEHFLHLRFCVPLTIPVLEIINQITVKKAIHAYSAFTQ
jgi:hypothetical protein